MATEYIDQITRGGGGFGFGGGDGGGTALGLVLGLLFGRRGLGGDEGGCNNNVDLSNIAQTLGNIQASVPLSEAQVQLALAGNQAAITQLVASVGNQLQNGQTALLLQGCNQTNALQQSICAVDTNVDRQATATMAAIHADGEATRELITRNRIADLEQQLTVAQLRESEQRGINRDQTNSHNITIQMQQQQQQQQLQMRDLQYQLATYGQYARATNGNVIVGNAGATTTGAQTASPTNVNA